MVYNRPLKRRRTILTISIDAELNDKLKVIAEAEHLPLSRQVERLLHPAVEAYEKAKLDKSKEVR